MSAGDDAPRPLVRLERQGDVALVTLDDPAAANAASLAMVEQLHDALEQASRRSRAIVITGAGKAFCAGANLGHMPDLTDPAYDAGRPLDSHYNPLIRAIRNSPVPVCAAVNGAAAGFGAGLALACDLIVAERDSFFLAPFAKIGLAPDSGLTFLLSRAVGRVRAIELMLLGDRLPAERALEWGLINRVAEKGQALSDMMELAARLAAGPAQSLSLTRRLAWDATAMNLEEALDAERAVQRDAGRTAEHREGIAAFLEKRPPRFSG